MTIALAAVVGTFLCGVVLAALTVTLLRAITQAHRQDGETAQHDRQGERRADGQQELTESTIPLGTLRSTDGGIITTTLEAEPTRMMFCIRHEHGRRITVRDNLEWCTPRCAEGQQCEICKRIQENCERGDIKAGWLRELMDDLGCWGRES